MQAQSHIHFMSASHMLVLVILLAQSQISPMTSELQKETSTVYQ